MSITRDEVLWGYRMILGRDPESEDALVANMASDDLYHLQQRFMSSEEFLLKRKNYFAAHLTVSSISASVLPASVVEYSATLEQLVDCVSILRTQYAKVGLTEPHFAVAVDSLEALNSVDANISQFWATGHAQAQELLQSLERFGLTGLANKTAVEFGCGIGRLSLGLAGKFKQLHSYDVSDSQIMLAKKASIDAGVNNCQFHLSSGNPFAALEPADFFYSKNTFQYYPPPIIHQFIRNALRSLRPDGLALFQVPTFKPNYSFAIADFLAKDSMRVSSHCLPQHAIFTLIAETKCELLEVKEEKTDLPAGTMSNVFLVRKTGVKQAQKLMLPVLLS